jgi:hypothetical protein
MADKDIGVGGTLVWYYHICKRQVWVFSCFLRYPCQFRFHYFLSSGELVFPFQG